MNRAFETVIGLEVHVELNTKTKIFCSCPTTFGAPPNTACCPVCMGLPGALPVLNRRAVELAVLSGLATDCTVGGNSRQDRKNYFYPDLPKGYQISQWDLPLCRNGSLRIETSEGEKSIGITRIHIEEDAGKLVHDKGHGTQIDCNRCGVPLIEIVSEPDLRSAEEAVAYLKKLRTVLIYAGISHCRMNEGAFRCDVNLSVRPVGETALGTRTEIKNLNSFAFVAKAIAFEEQRQWDALCRKEQILQETRRFDPATGKTYSMRSKENAKDYRYFPEPDLPAFTVDAETVARLRQNLPELPDSRKARYVRDLGISSYDAEVLTADRALSDYFEECAALTPYPKTLANLFLTELMRLYSAEPFCCPILPSRLAALATLIGEETVNYATAKKLLSRLHQGDLDPAETVQKEELWQITDEDLLRQAVQSAIAKNPRSVSDFHAGKRNAAGAIIGQVMAATGGRAHPTLLTSLVQEALQRTLP